MVCNNVRTETVWHLDIGALIDMGTSLFRQMHFMIRVHNTAHSRTASAAHWPLDFRNCNFWKSLKHHFKCM